jgi:hypothetical protein
MAVGHSPVLDLAAVQMGRPEELGASTTLASIKSETTALTP